MNICLLEMSLDKMHEFFRNFQYDTGDSYRYDKNRVDEYYKQHRAQGKIHYAIMYADAVIGDIYLKNIDMLQQSCEIGIHMINDHYKGKGYGAQALQLIKEIACKQFNLKTLYAETCGANISCCKALKKAGFEELSANDGKCRFLYQIRAK